MQERYEASIVLHGLGDTIGFNNTNWEFMKGGVEKVLEKVYQFIELGGVNYVPGKNWRISDDTILHIKTCNALLNDFKSINTFGETVKQEYINAYDEFIKEEPTKRAPGRTTMKNLERMKNKLSWNKLEYDFFYGGNGAAMRTPCIGLAYHKKEDLHKLIQLSIESSRITHNSAIGYLGGMTSALFTSLAIQNIKIKKWPFILVKMLEDSTVTKYIKEVGRDVGDYMRDYHGFLSKWKMYIDHKFDNDGNIVKKRVTKDLRWRTNYYHSVFSDLPDKNYFPGAAGDDANIIAYDCLLDSDMKWEKLVFYAMLNGGDADTIGCISASWYGAMVGYGDVPKHILNNIENHKELKSVGNKLYSKYYE